jgi:hypothetical protein
MKTFLTIILAMSFCFAEEPVKPLPKDVQTIVDSREADLQAARISFDKAVFEANKKAIGKMEAVIKTSTQKGDLDGALASRKFVEDWNKEKEAAAVSGGMGGAGPKGEKFNPVGIWLCSGADSGRTFNFSANGKWSSSWPDLGGTWKVDGEILIITSTFGNNQTVSVPAVREADWILNNGAYKISVKKK